jgi:hypothetical protein
MTPFAGFSAAMGFVVLPLTAITLALSEWPITIERVKPSVEGYSQGFWRGTPVGSTSWTLRVIKIRLWSKAVAANSPSMAWTGLP